MFGRKESKEAERDDGSGGFIPFLQDANMWWREWIERFGNNIL